MGFEDREYIQQEQGYVSWGSDTPSTKRLLMITVIVFVLQSVLTYKAVDPGVIIKFESLRISYVDQWFMLDAPAALSGQVWRILTYGFCHDRQSAVGLVFNMLALWFVGGRLERMYGSREFLLYYLGSIIFSGLIFVGIGMTTPLPIPLSGASAAVMALFTLYVIHFPREEILAFWLIPMYTFALLMIYVALDAYTVLQAMRGDTPWPYAAMIAAHLGGAAYAYLYKHFDWHLAGIWSGITNFPKRMRRRAVSSKLKVYAPVVANDDWEAKVDTILAKIHEHGSESLTSDEREILEKASQRERNKRSS
jgi:membrane associated rhomboid family serine protease